MMLLLLLLLVVGLLHQIAAAGTSNSQNQFTCQGTSYGDAVSKCPDSGALKMSSGGNVTIFVRSANNIPNYDHTGPSAGVSDPYVRFSVGSVVKETRNIRNTLNPVWNEFINLGVLGSGTLIIVEIWDKDTGLEFSDDLCVKGSVRVPFCSTFSANTTYANCGNDFGCSSQDSLWHMPTRQECVESGYVSFVNGQFCISGICLQLDFHIVPFAIGIEKIFKSSMISAPTVNAFAFPVQGVKYTKKLGIPFSDLPGTVLDYNQIVSAQLRGALMYQMRNTERYYGAANSMKFYGSTNFPAYIYICRNIDDNDGPPFGLGVPTWLSSTYSSRNVSIQQLILDGTTTTFGCFYTHVEGTVKNEWGGVISGAIPFKTNTISGYEGVQSSSGYNYNYIILAVPHTVAPREDVIIFFYDMAAFISFLFTYGLIVSIFTYCIVAFLRKIDYRVDRLSSFLSTRVLTGEDKSLLATLLLTYHESPCNIHYRAHMFHLRNALVFILSIPFWLLISWGFSVSVSVRPAGLGYAVAFIGPAALFFWFGMRLWEASLWRLSMMAATSLSLAVLLFLCFLIAVLFTDPGVLQLARSINFAAASLVFGTINVAPLLHLVFARDKSQQKHLAALMDKMLDAIFYVRKKGGAKGRSERSPNTFFNTNKLLHAILGETYTINPHVPAFQLAAILQEFPLAQQANDNDSENMSEQKKAALKDAKEKSHRLYYISLFVLFLYFIFAAVQTDHPGLAFLNILSLVFLDFIHVCLSRGDICWSPGFIITLMAVGRLLIMGSGASIWVLNYSAAYMMYAVVLVQEVINTYLPNLSQKKAGRMVFAGEAANEINSLDVAGTPFFCLGALTLAFCGVLVVAVLGSASGDLPSPVLNVLGNRTTWTTNVFGLIALLSTIVFALLWATMRAFYLQHHGLLRGWARDGFVFKKKINVSVFLTICLEVSILASGILVYGVTGSNVIIVSAIFLPMIAVCLGYAYYIWTKNDYELVVWPRKGVLLAQQNENASDLTVAFKMIEDQFGQDLQIENMESGPETTEMVVKEKKTLKGFKLPPIKAPIGSGNAGASTDDDVKMPPLPLKSVLRRKRQNLGIKTKKPVISQGDLRARDNAKDNDVFGDEGDVLDAEDPWAQYEVAEEDPNAKKKKVAITATVKHIPFMESGPVLTILKYLTIVHNFFAPKISYLVGLFRRNAKLYPFKVVKAEGEGEEEIGDEATDSLKDMKRESLSSMSFERAAWTGKLNRSEYIALASWYGGMLLVMFYGITLSNTVVPDYLGLLIWVTSWLVICTVVPLLKYFNTYTFDATMSRMVKFNLIFHFFFCLLFFVVTLHMDIGVVGTLWLIDYFFYYPVFVYALFEAYRWYDNGFKYHHIDTNRDGKISIMEFLTFIRSFPFIVFAAVVFNWQLYVWVNYLTGQTVTLLLLSVGLGYLFIRDWAVNELYLSPEMMYAGWVMIDLTLFITFMVALFSSSIPLFSSSIFCFTLSFKIMIKNLSRHYLLDPHATMMFFSPQIFPVYSYNSKQQDLIDESHVIKDLASVFAIGIVWGSLLAIFYYPIDVGIAIACTFLLGLGAAVSVAVSYVPGKLAKAAVLLNVESIIEVAGVAKEKFYDRRQPLNLESTEDDDDVYPVLTEEQEKEMELAKERASKASLDKQKERQSITIAVDIINDTRSLKYVKHDIVESNIADLQLEDEYDPTWYQKLAAEAKQFLKSLFEAIPVSRKEGWQKHSESSFTSTDALSEAILTGRGALGMFGFNGFWRYLFVTCKNSKNFKFLYPKFLDNYDEQGNNTKLVQLTEHMDSRSIFEQLLEYDKALDWTYKEECRCAVHFLLMMLVDADAKLNREQVLFQKFLRENRFRLASNGIVPPPEIFSSESFASINIPLVAVWLSTLSDDEVERFHTLKRSFSEEQRAKDELVDAADYDLFIDARNLEKERSQRDKDWAELFDRHVLMQKEERYQQFANTLLGVEKQRFLQRKDYWTSNPECFVILKEKDLYQRFKTACCSVEDEITEYLNRTITDIEAAQKDIRLGEYGRTYQFVDSSFMPNENSLGQGPANEHVLGWRCAPGISDMVDLFSGGPHPDHIDEGVFEDTWLVSALVMLVAASGFGENIVSELVTQLFVRHPSEDGDPTLDTDVGAYCVRIYRNGDYFPIILDDLLPMRRKEKWTNENRGMACAHNRECRGIWISLVEKAFAKYFGSYAALQKGYIHHALRDLTGCESEWIPLASASRGIGKKQLWDDLQRFKRNGYILGAGTGDSKLVDKEIQNSGIVFNSEYTIYELIETDGLQLLKLRNPPGDHEEWKGDWGDNSSLWTRKIRGKLNMVFADDNTFYMSFDDFCNVFRNLYVCRYCKPDCWQREELLPGLWKKADLHDIEKDQMMRQIMASESDDPSQQQEQVESEKEVQKTVAATIDSAGGLPIKRNPTCVLENNPYYSLRVHRPTDFRICVSQYSPKGNKSNFPIHPVSIFLIKNPAHLKTPVRLEKLNKDDVVAYTGPPVRQKVLNLYVNSCDPGLYVIMVATSNAGMVGNFTIRILSNFRTEFLALWPPEWMLQKEFEHLPPGSGALMGNFNQDNRKIRKTGMFRSTMDILVGKKSQEDSDDESEEGAPKT